MELSDVDPTAGSHRAQFERGARVRAADDSARGGDDRGGGAIVVAQHERGCAVEVGIEARPDVRHLGVSGFKGSEHKTKVFQS